MTSQSGSISEDWEELSNVGSVTSFDEESISTSTASVETQTPAIVPPTTAGPSSAQMQLPLRAKQDESVYLPCLSTHNGAQLYGGKKVPPSVYFSYHPFQHGTSTRTNISMSMGAGVPPIVRHDRSSAQEDHSSWFDDDFEDLELGPIQISRVGKLCPTEDPREYHEACATARRSLLEVQRLAQNIGGGRDLVLADLCMICDYLLVQMTELGKMAKLYAQHWMVHMSKGDPTESPLELNVWELLQQLLGKLRSTAAELSGEMPDYIYSLRFDGRGLRGDKENLMDISSHFANLMPILRADFDKYRRKHTDVQPVTTSPPEKPTHRVPQNPDFGRICTELDALKASLVSLSAFLKRLHSNETSKYIMGPSVTDTVDSIIEVIRRTPTNFRLGCAKGGLKPSQVIELDADCIHGLVRELKKYQREIDIDPDQVRVQKPYQMSFDQAMTGIRFVVSMMEALLLIP
ncbi:unnamed protein product [Fusarium graminearum]|nr:unnamed protein product [Fusarium graminearum]